jgi:hypothetical protein
MKSSPPPDIRVIKDSAFSNSSGLSTVILGEGLEHIATGNYHPPISEGDLNLDMLSL